MPLVDRALTTLDDVTVARVRPALAWLHEQTPGIGRDPDVAVLRRFLWRELPAAWPVEHREQHEVAWALGDLFEPAGLAEQAALCRAPVTHEIARGVAVDPVVPRRTGGVLDAGAGPARPAPGAAGQGRRCPWPAREACSRRWATGSR